MGTYREYIDNLKKAWIGKSVLFEGEKYNVVDVDYNGGLLIDKKARFTDTTAVGIEMVTVVKDFNHIHDVLVNSGYPESHNSEWFIKIEEYRDNLIVPHWYDCHTKARTKVAVKSLLNKTDVYTVAVHSPGRNVISFHGKFTALSEHEWNYYFER